jgi:hypothetical protein
LTRFHVEAATAGADRGAAAVVTSLLRGSIVMTLGSVITDRSNPPPTRRTSPA